MSDHPRPEEPGLAWLEAFERSRGRRLRVLHIGNIANNAYNNAKIQRRHGIDADVSSHDYFHVMASPEWEDAEFTGDVVDQLYPDWWNAGAGSSQRPAWFAQGNWRTCQRYLLARSRGEDGRAALLSRALTVERWLWCRSTPLARALGYRGGLAGFLRALARLPRAAARLLVGVAAVAHGRGLRATAQLALPVRVARALGLEGVDETETGRRFAQLFPDRQPFGSNDLRGYRTHARGWDQVLREYDVVQGYSLDAVVPLLCGTRAWTAYEHGTLREIPFQETPSGRLCALTYREAPVVFVTNSDVLPSVELLGLDPNRVVYLPHAVDSDRLFAFAEAHSHLAPGRGSTPTLYSPSRQDWVDGDVSWAKGNDRVLHAAATLLDRDFRFVLTAWGRDLGASRALVTELGLTERVEWVAPVRKHELWTRFLSCHAVLDQFVLPAIGGNTFEALALGRRVITALNTAQSAQFFGRPPALLAAQSIEEIAAAIERVLDDPDDEEDFGATARTWFAERHSAERIVELQARAYRRLIEGAPAAVLSHA